MSKIAINNEIVLMRQAVRQSRVCVVRKLIKEVKLLGGRKHGDEKILEKCKRKAERLAAEIASIKKIKDDEISKFGIMETKSLPEILSERGAEPTTRIMARLAHHKILRDRISKFREKFPVYEEFLGPGRKKMSKLERKANREARNSIKQNRDSDEQITDGKEAPSSKGRILEDNESSQDDDDDASEVAEAANQPPDGGIDASDAEDPEDDKLTKKEPNTNDPEPGSILRIEKSRSPSKKRKNDLSSQPTRKEQSENVKTSKKSRTVSKVSAETKKSIPIKVISEEATVKRFADLIGGEESSEIVAEPVGRANPRKHEVKIEKQVDSFFMTENGESEYMSVVVPKQKISPEEEEEDDVFPRNHAAKRQKKFHEKNNKFFSKIDQPGRDDFGDKSRSNFDKRKTNVHPNGKDRGDKFTRKDSSWNHKSANANFGKNNDLKEEELHPSWAARKKQQEILKQGFQGKKIVFDD